METRLETVIGPDRPNSKDIAQLFDELAEGYDHAALRFFPFAADRLATRLAPRPDEKILDVATGTGAVAVALAQRLAGGGRVIAVDISERMLDCAYANLRRMALPNVDLHPMDASALEFRDQYFDALSCSFGLFFLPDMSAALWEWRRVLRPGGRMLMTSFASEAFMPLLTLFCADICRHGGPELEPGDMVWQTLAEPERIQSLLQRTGYQEVVIETEQLGYHLQSPRDWWDIVWNSAMRRYLKVFDAKALQAFREAHLAAVAAMFENGPVWLDIPVLFAAARTP